MIKEQYEYVYQVDKKVQRVFSDSLRLHVSSDEKEREKDEQTCRDVSGRCQVFATVLHRRWLFLWNKYKYS